MARDPYEILGIGRDATLREASAAYRRLAELYHPDRLRGFRQDVQDEGARHLRDATQAIRVLRSRLRGPLVAAGHERDSSSRSRNPGGRSQNETVRSSGGGHVPPSPSDAATGLAARVYYVNLQSIDAPEFQARWAGRHAEATLAALKDGHRLDGGPIRQVEWGTYAAVLEGDATRRLLERVLRHDDGWRHDPAEILAIAAESTRLVPARRDDDRTIVTLDAVVEALNDDTRYEVLADAY